MEKHVLSKQTCDAQMFNLTLLFQMIALNTNLKQWITKGSQAVVEDVSSKTDFTVDTATNVAVWDGSQK